MEASTDYFISMVECNKIIYDKSSKDFKNVIKKDEAWARIAKNGNMTVVGAKKRYASLRQKLCREKAKYELQRRIKSKSFKPWVYYDRLQFLDEYIQPRSTYTNDTGYQDINGSSSLPATDVSMTLAEEHAMDFAEVNQNLDQENFNDNVVGNGGSDEIIVLYNPEDVHEHTSFQLIDDSGNICSTVISEYSGELSSFQAATADLPCTIRIEESEHSLPDAATNNSACEIRDVVLSRDVTNNLACSSRHDESEYVRGDAATNSASATRNELLPAHGVTRNLSRSDQNAANNLQASTQKNLPPSNSTFSSSAPASKSKDKPQHTKSISTSRKQVPQTKVVQKTVEPPSLPRTDQGMEAVQHKLDSCITSLNTKISEKQQRSPHVPFLAYLGTKLPNVEKEQLATLEKQILELVESFCQ